MELITTCENSLKEEDYYLDINDLKDDFTSRDLLKFFLHLIYTTNDSDNNYSMKGIRFWDNLASNSKYKKLFNKYKPWTIHTTFKRIFTHSSPKEVIKILMKDKAADANYLSRVMYLRRKKRRHSLVKSRKSFINDDDEDSYCSVSKLEENYEEDDDETILDNMSELSNDKMPKNYLPPKTKIMPSTAKIMGIETDISKSPKSYLFNGNNASKLGYSNILFKSYSNYYKSYLDRYKNNFTSNLNNILCKFQFAFNSNNSHGCKLDKRLGCCINDKNNTINDEFINKIIFIYSDLKMDFFYKNNENNKFIDIVIEISRAFNNKYTTDFIIDAIVKASYDLNDLFMFLQNPVTNSCISFFLIFRFNME